jgi:CDP-diacylglycerol---serine O-phosphatidyltransferase
MIGKHIPNTITSLNLASGCASVIFAFDGNYTVASYLILLAAVFDFFDGFAARLLKAYSPVGKELDSLADVVSFGVAPGMIIYKFMHDLCETAAYPEWLSWFALLIPVFSALRLAKFNIDERQSSSFLGLPTPANGLFWSFGLAFFPENLVDVKICPFLLILAIVIFSWLLICEIPMFSLKFKNYIWNKNRLRYIYLAISLILIIIFGFAGISVCIMLYIFMSIFYKP